MLLSLVLLLVLYWAEQVEQAEAVGFGFLQVFGWDSILLVSKTIQV
jgi:hypothetical protein